MCGLAGLFLPDDAPVVEADLDAMADALGHRGPDGRGRWVSDDRRYQAVFTRLAIIDVDGADQPLVAEGGGRVLMGNGEIYNYRELRAGPACAAYPFRTDGDIEVVLPLAGALGDRFVHELNGMYALALWRARPRRLLLVRDRLGIKPLYYAVLAGGGVVFASEIKALFASGLVRPAVEETAVNVYLAHGFVPGPDTLFRGVRKLPPGHVLSVDGRGSLSLDRYWKPVAASDGPSAAEEREAHLLDLLADSVRLQLRSDVPVGALLSGGLDSGLIVALAAGQTDHPLNTFTVRFRGASYDESPLAAAVAARYGTRHTTVEVATDDVAGLLPRLAWHAEDPLFDAALLPNFLIEEALGHHVKVALNGTGGDELFAGYGRYFQLAVERRYLGLPRWMRRGAVEPLADRLAPAVGWRLRRAGKWATDRGAYLHEHTGHFPPPVRALIGNRMASPPPAQVRAFAAFVGPADTAMLAADLATYLPDDLLALLDRTSMAVGVEGRVPFLDHRLVEAALAVPPALRTAGGRPKALERRLAARYLPETVCEARKQGFTSPVPAWMRGGLGGLAGRVLTRPAALERGWWTAAGVTRLIADPEQHGFRVYTLLMLELAVRVFVDGGGRRPHEGLEAYGE